MSAKVVLTIASGPLKGKEFQFTTRTKWTVGRACECDLTLPGGDNNLFVSRKHCVLEIDPPDVWIRDLGSLNGTYVNGLKIGGRDQGIRADDWDETLEPDTILRDGDVVRVGSTLFYVSVCETDWEEDPAAGIEFPAHNEAIEDFSGCGSGV
jgi:serine/threonine-protein kinase